MKNGLETFYLIQKLVIVFSDMHINQINNSLTCDKYSRLKYSLKCFDYFLELINKNKCSNLFCYLFISLKSSDKKELGINFVILENLLKEL